MLGGEVRSGGMRVKHPDDAIPAVCHGVRLLSCIEQELRERNRGRVLDENEAPVIQDVTARLQWGRRECLDMAGALRLHYAAFLR